MNLIKILGIDLLPLISFQEAYNYIKKEAESGKPGYITVNNVHTVVESVKNVYYKNVLKNSTLPFTDSQPLNIILKKKGAKNAIRIFGPSLMEKILEIGQNDGLNHFFFGSSESTLDKLKEVVLDKYPKVKISNMISPPYRVFTEEENKSYIDEINHNAPDIIWVSLGAPKQEIWMHENFMKLNSGIMIGVGAAFDYLAGNTKHAPEWMKNMALEWFYRLTQEPKRLWKRYLLTNTLFMYYITLELLGSKKFE